MIETRPDIAFVTFIVSWFIKNSFHQHIKAVKKIIKYSKAAKSVKIPYGREERGGKNLTIKEYSNFN